MKILFIHRCGDGNVGDLASCPANYFPWKDLGEVRVQDIFTSVTKPVDVLIIGGGGLLHPGADACMLAVVREARKLNAKTLTVVWGVGTNYHHTLDPMWPEWLSEFSIVGLRDRLYPKMIVPCASCMHPWFDAPNLGAGEGLAVYEHAAHKLNLKHPTMENFHHSVDDVMGFMSRAEVVLTNSFHGAYWCQLIGKPVVVVEPFSGRFHHGLPRKVTHSSKDNLRDNILLANLTQREVNRNKGRTEVLVECREKNKAMFEEVKRRIYKL